MTVKYCTTLVWLILNLLISIYLYKLIYKHISKKSLMKTTLVDWIYQDTIIYIYLLVLIASVALMHCLMQNNKSQTLNYPLSVFYSGCVMFFMCCVTLSLAFSGGLRLLSLIRNSEEAGLLLLGPENIAIFKIRIISILSSLSFQIIMIFHWNAHSGLFHLLYEGEDKSHFDEFEENRFKMLYLLWPLSAVIINTITKLYTVHLKRELNTEIQVFTVEQQNFLYSPKTEKISLQLNFVIGIPLTIMFAVFSSIATRRMRLLFFYPLQMTLLSVVLPLLIISRNKKLKKNIEKKITDLRRFAFKICKRFFSSKVTPIQDVALKCNIKVTAIDCTI